LPKLNENKGRILGALIGAALVLSASLAWSAETGLAPLTKRLFDAVATNNMASVRSSITAGANITAINQEGMTAAGLAIEKGYFNIAHYILGVRNQRTTNEEDSVLPELPKFPAINIPTQATAPPPQIAPGNIPAQTPALQHPVQAGNQWPKDQPNPFAPDSQAGSIPIVGALQKPTVEPALPKKAVISNLKEQTPKMAPLKTATAPAQREIQAPSLIKPLRKDMVKGSPISQGSGTSYSRDNDKGILDRMVDGVTGVFKSEENPKASPTASPSPTTLKAKTSEPEKDPEKDNEDGVINRMWNSITNIF